MTDYFYDSFSRSEKSLFIKNYEGTLYELITNTNISFSDILFNGRFFNHEFNVDILLKINELEGSVIAIKYLYSCNVILNMYLLNILLDNRIIESIHDPILKNNCIIDTETLHFLINEGFRLTGYNIFIIEQLMDNSSINLLRNLGHIDELCIILDMVIFRSNDIEKILTVVDLIHVDEYHEFCKKSCGNRYLSMRNIIDKYGVEVYIDIQHHNIEMDLFDEDIKIICDKIKLLINHVDEEYMKCIISYMFAYTT